MQIAARATRATDTDSDSDSDRDRDRYRVSGRDRYTQIEIQQIQSVLIDMCWLYGHLAK